MRTIKFRVWTEVSNEVLGMRYFGLGNGAGMLNDTVMQFTGLLDKNGKEIYESDLLKDLEDTVGEVKFVHGRFEAKDGAGWDNLEFPEESEVIGNIYEN